MTLLFLNLLLDFFRGHEAARTTLADNFHESGMIIALDRLVGLPQAHGRLPLRGEGAEEPGAVLAEAHDVAVELRDGGVAADVDHLVNLVEIDRLGDVHGVGRLGGDLHEVASKRLSVLI